MNTKSGLNIFHMDTITSTNGNIMFDLSNINDTEMEANGDISSMKNYVQLMLQENKELKLLCNLYNNKSERMKIAYKKMKGKYSTVKEDNKELYKKLEEQAKFIKNNGFVTENSSRKDFNLRKSPGSSQQNFYSGINEKMNKKNNKSQIDNNENSFNYQTDSVLAQNLSSYNFNVNYKKRNKNTTTTETRDNSYTTFCKERIMDITKHKDTFYDTNVNKTNSNLDENCLTPSKSTSIFYNHNNYCNKRESIKSMNLPSEYTDIERPTSRKGYHKGSIVCSQNEQEDYCYDNYQNDSSSMRIYADETKFEINPANISPNVNDVILSDKRHIPRSKKEKPSFIDFLESKDEKNKSCYKTISKNYYGGPSKNQEYDNFCLTQKCYNASNTLRPYTNNKVMDNKKKLSSSNQSQYSLLDLDYKPKNISERQQIHKPSNYSSSNATKTCIRKDMSMRSNNSGTKNLKNQDFSKTSNEATFYKNNRNLQMNIGYNSNSPKKLDNLKVFDSKVRKSAASNHHKNKREDLSKKVTKHKSISINKEFLGNIHKSNVVIDLKDSNKPGSMSKRKINQNLIENFNKYKASKLSSRNVK